MGTHVKKLAVGALTLIMLFGVLTIAQAQESDGADSAPTRLGPDEGAAFAMTNRSTDNEIISYRRAANGALTRVGSMSTRGNGIGTDLDTQGALRLSADNRFLYAANAGSDDVTVFSVNGTQLTFLQKVYAGDNPNSLTINGNLLYVLDGSVAGNGIRGFRRTADGTLTPLPFSFRLLSSPIAVPGQVEFSPDGRFLLVTQKTTNVLLTPPDAIDVFRVLPGGLTLPMPQRMASNGLRPFSLAFRNDSQLLVVESFNAADGASAASSYRLTDNGTLEVISGSIPNQQTDTCWVVITKDGRYAFTANFGSGTISSYRFAPNGQVVLVEGNAAFLGMDSQPVDLALSADSRYLYLLLRGTGGVASFRIQDDGGLSPLGVVTGGLPVADGASGLAVF
ncbi:MAG: lactonase family protein [Actinomycetota bacterium]|nr:beta-propeller fold lactonase family protein [Geodermatophilaceae bacterium]MDQ3504162.1 lactonase family protein [Actinomycetota bacterium]